MSFMKVCFLFVGLLLLTTPQTLAQTVAWVSSTATGTGVCGNQASPFQTLSSAFTTCHAASGDFTVNVLSGTYPAAGNSQVPLGGTGALTIQAVDATSPPIFDLTTGNANFASVGSGVSLTLKNLIFNGGYSDTNGGLISAVGGTLNAQGVVFNGATAGLSGGAISLSGSSLGSLFTGCQFINCRTTGALHSGGAVALSNASAVFINTLFQNCSSQIGGAVSISNPQNLGSGNSAKISFQSCTFTDNSVDATGAGRAATLGGGAVNFNAAASTSLWPSFTGCNFTNNQASASQGGAIFVGPSLSLSIASSTFSYGNAFMGGAIYGDTGVALDISGSTFKSNTAAHVDGEASGKGGAIYLKAGFITTVNSVFDGNRAGENGGAVHVVGGQSHYNDPTAQDTTNFTQCTFSNNVAGATGGAIAAEYLKMYVTIDDTNFLGNSVTGIGLEAGGGAIFTNSARLGIGANSQVNSFERNTAAMSMGGSIYSFIPLGADNSNPNNFNGPFILNTVFSDSIASTGGAICLDGPGDNLGVFAFEYVRFSNNQATGSASPDYGVGGAIMSWNTTYVFISSGFFNNFARSGGGALWAGGESPSFPHMLNCTFAGNNVSTSLTNGVSAMFRGATSTVFRNTHLNGPLTSPDQVDLFVGDNAIVQIVADSGTTANTKSSCEFNGFNVQDNAYIIFNCTPTVAVAFLDNNGNVSLNQAARLTITNNLNWYGGGFACNAADAMISYSGPSSLGNSAELVNNNAKFLQKCNLAFSGNSRVTHHAAGSPYDLLLTEGALLYNFGTLATAGDVTFFSQGASSFFENDASVLIEQSFYLTASAGNTFGWSSVGKNTLIFIHLFDPSTVFNPSIAEEEDDSAVQAAADAPQPYTALSVQGKFVPGGLLQINFPDLYKGFEWSNIINYTSHSGSFKYHRGSIPNKKGQLVGTHLKSSYSNTGLTIKVRSTISLVTGPQVFGIIFGVLTLVSIALGAAYYFYSKKHGSVEYHGQVYETIEQPVYGTA